MKPEIKDLIDISRYYGQQKEFVIAGGGNTSYKNDEKLWIGNKLPYDKQNYHIIKIFSRPTW